MPDVKISAGADPGALTATDKLPLARSASTTAYAATVAEIATYANGAYTPNYYTGTPSMDSVGAPGTAAFVARGDHVHPSDTTRMSKAGTTTNDNAAAGQVGEYLSSSVLVGSALALVNNVSTNLLTLSLTAGDWEVWGTVDYTNVSVGLNIAAAGISTVSATLPAGSAGGLSQLAIGGGSFFANGTALSTGPVRVSIAATTTVYLVVFGGVASGTLSAFGMIAARRMR